MTTARTIVIAGAGIGGLTAALTLAGQGYHVVVLEKAERLADIGAGIQISPNAARILIALGLKDAIAARATSPDAVRLMSARAGGEIARLPFRDNTSGRAGAPYWVIHRADLQAVLLDAVRAHADIDLRLGHPFESAAAHANGVSVDAGHGHNRESISALALIGADGVWSGVRQHIFPEAKPNFSGLTAWRGMIDARVSFENCVQVWMGPNAHLVMYPISGGRQINVVAIVRGDWKEQGWSAPGHPAEIRSRFAAGWPAPVQRTIDAVDQFTRYALFTMPDGGIWNAGPVTLLGDASHAMLPFAAQGAGMAIEDAAVLAKCVGRFGASTTPASIVEALAAFGHQRRTRITRVHRTARQSGKIYHLRGPMALARDLTIGLLGGKRLLERQNWIYDWSV